MFREVKYLEFVFEFSLIQFKMVYMRSEKPICAHFRLSEASPTLPLKHFQGSSDWRWRFLVLSRKVFLERTREGHRQSSSASSLHTSVLHAIDGVMSLALCPQVVFQAPQNSSSSDTQAICDGYFARQSIYSVISLHSRMSMEIHP